LGIWDVATQTAALTWTPSARTDLLHYEVRACLGKTYNTQNEYRVATVAKDVLTWNTNEGLSTPGSVIHYKVYVVTQTHRERGSKAVKVTRPASTALGNAA
ncbi:MAG: hypothetical protein SFY80_00005, partial [Verrucomicrobiota bacterium]|nr:hypothetical protein [Verrucomicrobiota bacterium]